LPGVWNTLSLDEWSYLFNTRTSLRATATVDGRAGLIIMPDGWTATTVTPTITTSDYTTNVISASDWTVLEGEGCIFLPVTGYRVGVVLQGREDIHGIYWTSTASGTAQARDAYIDANQAHKIWTTESHNRSLGIGVRLVFQYWNGSGTEADPYQIANEYDWNKLVYMVRNGNTFSGEYFQLTDDIAISTMVGTDMNHAFNGTFDGAGHTITATLNSSAANCAPFAYTYGATIKNLHTTGTINTSSSNAGGVVGRNGTASLTLTNVSSDITISSVYSGNASHGGLVGYTINATLTGCAFTGQLLGAITSRFGGLVGWKTNTDNSSVTFTDCLFAPALVTMSETNSKTFAVLSSGAVAHFTNCYYTQAYGTDQGKQARSVTGATGVTVANAGTATEYNISGITSYGTGIKYNGVLYAANGEELTMALTHGDAPANKQFDLYAASAGTLSAQTETSATLSMPDEAVTISAQWTLASTLDYYRYDPKARGYYKEIVTGFTLLTDQTSLTDGTWYVVNGDVTISDRITVNGTVHLLLLDDAHLTASKGITVNDGNTLNIYGQAENTGSLTATAAAAVSDHTGDAGIGGTYSNWSCGTINIHGGTITATGVDGVGTNSSRGGAGIGSGGAGSGQSSNTGTIMIGGGTVTATGGVNGAGIGGGNNCNGYSISIYGGTITANGGAAGNTNCASAIGGGDWGNGGNIAIYGGSIKAYTPYNIANAIGKGGSKADGTLTISPDLASTYGMTFYAGTSEGAKASVANFNTRYQYMETVDPSESIVITAESTDYSGTYDGLPHTVTGKVTPIEPEQGATVKFGASQESCTEDTWVSFTEAGTHHIYYQISKSGYKTMTSYATETYATVDIAKAPSSCTAPTAIEGLTYTGSAQALVNAGTAIGGTMYYSLDNSSWSADIPTGTDFGNYTVYYKVVGDTNHEDYTPASNTVTMTIALGITANYDAGTGAYYATFYFSSRKFALPNDGTEAYVAEVSGDALLLHKIAENDDVLPAATPVIFKTTSSTITLVESNAEAVPASETNNLLGADAAMSVADAIAAGHTCYVLSGGENGVGFYQYTGSTLGAHKAFLDLNTGAGAPRRMRFLFDEENAATSVENAEIAVKSEKRIENGQLIIIRNGEKFNAQGMIVK